jgi:F0F1-type ATP synthase assembly protein I
MEPQKNKTSRKSNASMMRYMDIPFKMAATIGLGTWFGQWLDGKMSMEKPIFLLLFMVLGIAAAMYLVIKDANNLKNTP